MTGSKIVHFKINFMDELRQIIMRLKIQFQKLFKRTIYFSVFYVRFSYLKYEHLFILERAINWQ